MKKNEIFTFTAPNGVEVTAVVLYVCGSKSTEEGMIIEYICYAQNRLFSYFETLSNRTRETNFKILTTFSYGEIIVDYAILPDYDAMLEAYSDHQVTLAEEQSGM